MKIILTGGAGFIGSCLLKKLNEMSVNEIIVVDHLNEEKWKNLIGTSFYEYYEKDDFIEVIEKEKIDKKFDFLIHLGACTDTMEKNAKYMIENNYIYSKKLLKWAIKNNVNFIYASSASTYGKGENGFSDDHENIKNLKPLNLYGFSKHLFDLWIVNNGLIDRVTGLKFFNVYGENEFHKRHMASVILKGYYQIKKEGKIKLFKSYHPQYKDGEQRRDFVYVWDVVDVIVFFIENPDKKGIFNVGTGKARTFNEVAEILFNCLKVPKNIEYIDMPEGLRENYQYFTEGKIEKLRKAGYKEEFTQIEEGIRKYVEYLENINREKNLR